MDSDYRCEKRRKAKEQEDQKRKEKMQRNILIFRIMERRLDPESASALGKIISEYYPK